MHSLIISDLHLSADRPKCTKLFLNFLKQEAAKAEALYILGDFFEFWVGDDYEDSFTKQIKKALSELYQQETKLYFMHGNRDFLVGKKFCNDIKATLINDPFTQNLYGQNITMTHGDFLCIDDQSYQRFRWFTRLKWLQKIFLFLPLSLRVKIAQKLRHNSETQFASGQKKPVDVNLLEVEKFALNTNCDALFQGHTHRYATHKIKSPQKAHRYVLGDWHEDGGSYIFLSKDKISLNRYCNLTHSSI